jgi:hypothetical protein
MIERFIVQFTARKRDPETGRRYRWTHGTYSREGAEQHAAKMRQRPTFKRKIRVDVRPERGG